MAIQSSFITRVKIKCFLKQRLAYDINITELYKYGLIIKETIMSHLILIIFKQFFPTLHQGTSGSIQPVCQSPNLSVFRISSFKIRQFTSQVKV